METLGAETLGAETRGLETLGVETLWVGMAAEEAVPVPFNSPECQSQVARYGSDCQALTHQETASKERFARLSNLI